MTRFLVWLTALTLLTAAYGQEPTPRAEILWDSWDVPHIFADGEAYLESDGAMRVVGVDVADCRWQNS